MMVGVIMLFAQEHEPATPQTVNQCRAVDEPTRRHIPDPPHQRMILPEGRSPYIHVQLKPESTIPAPEDWTWKVATVDNELRWGATMKWYAQAACPDALTQLSVSGPAGLLDQNPLKNPIWGYFSTQSFSIETVKEVCEDWANANSCDPTDPGCHTYEDFNLVGGVAPASNADRLRLKASCFSGPVADTYYGPKLRIRCDRAPY